MSAAAIIVLIVIAVLGHAMALFWYLAVTRGWPISRRVIYDLPIKPEQIRRELPPGASAGGPMAPGMMPGAQSGQGDDDAPRPGDSGGMYL